jgi:hypothetical protein
MWRNYPRRVSLTDVIARIGGTNSSFSCGCGAGQAIVKEKAAALCEALQITYSNGSQSVFDLGQYRRGCCKAGSVGIMKPFTAKRTARYTTQKKQEKNRYCVCGWTSRYSGQQPLDPTPAYSVRLSSLLKYMDGGVFGCLEAV